MNRRNFIATVGAVLAAPIAVAKGWLASKPKYPLDDDGWPCMAIPREAVCESCNRFNTPISNYEGNPDERLPVGISCFVPETLHRLCDNCAEKQGYLCKNRNGPTGINYWMETEGCQCGKRGCPSRPEPINLVVKRKRSRARMEMAESI